jgi:hypothetical protein
MGPPAIEMISAVRRKEKRDVCRVETELLRPS